MQTQIALFYISQDERQLVSLMQKLKFATCRLYNLRKALTIVCVEPPFSCVVW